MKALSLLAAVSLYSYATYGQEVVIDKPTPPIESVTSQTPTNLPPLEIDVPIFQPRQKVEEIYTEIKGSKFFLEVNPLIFTHVTQDSETNEENNGVPVTKVDYSKTKFRLMPLDFKIGFDNENWGSFADIYIEGSSENSEIVIYSRISALKIGGALQLKSTTREKTVTSNGTPNKTINTKETSFSTAFYLAGAFANSEKMFVEGYTYIGGGYASDDDGSLKTSGAYFYTTLGLDIYHKINKNFMLGFGGEFYYSRFVGDVSYTGSTTHSGIGNTFSFEWDFIKAKFLF